MQPRFLIAVLGICVTISVTAHAQTPKQLETTFRDQLVKQQLILRTFDGAPVVKGRWNGTDLTLQTPQWHTFGVLVASSVSVKGQHVSIAGERRVYRYDSVNGFGLTPQTEDAEIDVDMDGDPALLLPKLRDALFFATPREAVAAAPKWVLKLTSPPNMKTSAPGKSCSVLDEDGLALSNSDGIKHPELKKEVEATFSNAASQAKYSANVMIGFVLDERGTTHDFWAAYPVRYGLTEEAVKAVKQYAFKPATCHGTPVAVQLWVDVDFKIFP